MSLVAKLKYHRDSQGSERWDRCSGPGVPATVTTAIIMKVGAIPYTFFRNVGTRGGWGSLYLWTWPK